jgi:hypothetical protein
VESQSQALPAGAYFGAEERLEQLFDCDLGEGFTAIRDGQFEKEPPHQ